MRQQDLIRINELVCRSLEGELSQEQAAALNSYVRSDPELAAYYVRCVRIYSGLKKSPQMQYLFCLEQMEHDLKPYSMEALAEYEKVAPAMEHKIADIPAPVYQIELNREKRARKINKASLLTAISSLAAIILLVVFMRYVPVRNPIQVATLSDSINAQWAQPGQSLEKGTRLATDSGSYLLHKGAAKLVFDNQTEVVVEGPAEFEITAENRIEINYGRLFAVVPPPALGFSVTTPNCTIIDLGTEFGVIAGLDTNTELHVLKGETALVAGHRNTKTSVLVKQGHAKRIFGGTSLVADIDAKGHLFVQNLNSKNDFLWRGGTLDLSDILGGGNGLGTGQKECVYSPLEGKRQTFSGTPITSAGPDDYRRITDNPMIDGIFVPNGQTGPVQISSEKHVFENCPATSRRFLVGIKNYASHGPGSVTRIPKHNLRLDGKTFGSDFNSALFMHANMGITFNLDEIRKNASGLKIVRFTSKAGLSETLLDFPEPDLRDAEGRFELPLASFYVLVDGKIRFEKIDATVKDGASFIDIPLTEQDRFLTLVTTQGRDKGIHLDWTLFAEPFLQIER